MQRFWVLALAGAGMTTMALGQSSGVHQRLDARRLRLATDTFAAFFVRGADTTLSGFVITSLQTNGRRLTRIYSEVGQIISTDDTLVDRLDDFRPLAHYSHSPMRVARIDFDSATATGWQRLANGDTIPIHASLPRTLYNSASFDLIVRASALSAGFELTLPGFQTGPNTVAVMHGRVTGSDTVDGHACWVFKGDNAGTPVTFWVDKATAGLRRQVIQFRVDMSHVLVAVPASLLFVTDAEKQGLNVEPSAFHHPDFGFSAPLPKPGYAPDTTLQRRTLEGESGHPNVYVWALTDSARASIIMIMVYKGFHATAAALQQFALEMSDQFKAEHGWEVLLDSTFWDTSRRETILTARYRNGRYVSTRCVPSPDNRRPELLVCVQTMSASRHALDLVRDDLQVAGPPTRKP